MLLYPNSIDQLMEMSTNAKGPGWPGIKVLEGQAGMFPITCPLSRDHELEMLPVLPNGDKLRYVISKIVGTARTPIACVSFSTLRRKWKVGCSDF